MQPPADPKEIENLKKELNRVRVEFEKHKESAKKAEDTFQERIKNLTAEYQKEIESLKVKLASAGRGLPSFSFSSFESLLITRLCL